jgi:GT2 family glycosyltransferase
VTRTEMDRVWPKVTTIVINWNNYELTARSLRSLALSDYTNLNVVLVDNGSTDSSCALLETEFRWLASIIRIERNSGFTGATNAGISAAREMHAEYYFLLTGTVDKTTVSQLVLAAKRDDLIAALNPKIFYLNRPQTIWHARGHFNWWLALTHSHAGSRSPAVEVAEDVNFLTGSALFLRAAVVEQIGPLDEQYFMYFEDVDYTRRVLSAGYRAVYEPSAHAWHAVQGSVGRNAPKGLPIRYVSRNRLLLMQKHADSLQWLTFLPALLIWHIAAHVAVYFLRGQWENIPAILGGIEDFRRMGKSRQQQREKPRSS